jgi:predicted dehydrogenase
MSFDLLLVGLGTRGKMWAKVIAHDPLASIAAAVDPNQEARAAFVPAHPHVPVFATIEAALASRRFQAAILVTPPDGHLDQCRKLFEAGLPILAEKPLTVDLAEALAILDLADHYALPLSVGLNFRFLPVHQKQRELLTSAFLGEVGFADHVAADDARAKHPSSRSHPLLLWPGGGKHHVPHLEPAVEHVRLRRQRSRAVDAGGRHRDQLLRHLVGRLE